MIVIEYVELTDGTVCVLRNKEQLEADAASMKASKIGNPDQNKQFADDMVAAETKLRTTYQVKSKSFNYAPYTHGDKLAAKRKATIVNAQIPEQSTIDQDEFNTHLIAAATGQTYEQVSAMPEWEYNALANAVWAKTGMSADRAAFFPSSALTSPKEASKAQ